MENETPPQPPREMPEPTDAASQYSHQLKDGTVLLVGKPEGVLRLRLRALLGDMYKEDEYKSIGAAFLSIRKWAGGYPSPLTNPTQFEGMLSRFANDDDLDMFMDKWQKLTQPELSKIVAETFQEALDKGWDDTTTQRTVRERTAPLAKERLDRLRDS